MPASVLAGVAVVVGIEAIVVFSNHCHRTGVLGTVAAATFAVVIGGVWIEAGAGVARVAFAGFGFGLFGFSLFPLLGPGLGGGSLGLALGCLAPRLATGSLPPFPRFGPARFTGETPVLSSFGRNTRLAGRRLPGLLLGVGLRVGTAADTRHRGAADHHSR